jgi:DNA-binding transcriptional MerR regulator
MAPGSRAASLDSAASGDPAHPERPAESGGVYSIGAVASMLALPPATLRTWEDRYGIVCPERTRGGQRLYSRTQIDHLRFVIAEMARGASAADAHRSLAQRMLTDTAQERHGQEVPRVLILVAERDEYSAKLIEFRLGREGFAVAAALDVDEARRQFELTRPDLVILEFLLGGGEGEVLCRWLKGRGAGRVLVVVVSELDASERALAAGADAFLRKPVGSLQLLSVVKDLLGLSAIVGQQG